MFSLKSKNNSSAVSDSFDDLLKEAQKKYREVEALRRPPKLSASSFLKKSYEIDGKTESQRDEIEKALELPQFQNTRTLVSKLVDYIKGPDCSMPSYKLNRLSFLMHRDEFNAVIGELASVSASPFVAFSIAAKKVVREYPDAFGTIEDMSKHQDDLKAAECRLQDLFRRIETEWGPSDIDMSPAGGDLFRV